jgi:hypothetical protein
LLQRGVVYSQGLPIILQVEQEWSLDKCAAAQNRQALVEHLSPIWPNFWQLIHYVVGETFRYLTTLAATPTIRISFYLRISYLFSSFSIAKTIEPNLVYGLYLFSLGKIHLGNPCILIGLKVSISSFRSLKPPSPRKGEIGTP